MKNYSFFISLLILLAISIPSAWAEEATFGSDWNSVFGTNYSGSISGVKANALTLTGTVNSVTLTATNGSSTNGYLKTSDWRLYNGYTLTISAPQNNIIKAIVATKGGKSISGISTTTGKLTIAQDGSSMSWSGEENQVVFNVTATMGFDQIKVTYSSNSTPSKTLSSIVISGTPTKTAYNVGQEFEPAGLTVTGTYNDDSSAPIVSGIAWSYDPSAMLALNQTSIKVKATVDAIESSWFTVNDLIVTEAPAADIYELATNASALSEGDEIIIVNETAQKAMSTTQNTSNRGVADVTITNNAITPGDGVQIITLGKSNGNWILYTGNGYLYASSSSANQLKTQAINNANGEWTISISDGVATLTAQGTNTRKVMQYNSTSSLFACYASDSQAPIKIFKKSDGSTPKAAAGLAYADADLSKLVKLGGAFTAPTLTNPNSLEVTYTSDNTTVAEVTSNGAVTIKAAGKAVITASSEETENYKAGSASYTIYVVAHAGTQADPYTVADARLAIDCGAGVSGVYATGIVSQIVTAYNAQYGNITYNFSTDGQTTSDQLQAFRGKAKDGENFTSADDVKVGDEVVVKGDLTKYNSTYEFAADNQLYSLTRNKEDAGLAYETEEVEKTVGDDAFVNALTNPNSVPVTYKSSNANVAEIANDGTVTIKAQGSATISATFTGDETYKPATVTYTITVNPASEDTRKTAQDIDGFDAINGNLNNDISFASNQGDGTAAPNLKDGSIQYYQPGTGKGSGGYMTITAVKGCKIDQVKVVIATNATSIKYSKDDGDLSEATEVKTGADYLTPAALNAQTVNIYCAGADKNHRLFIAQVVVYYTGEPVAVDHLILSGEYQTEFVQGDEFNHDGLIVSAAYDAQGSETVDVTAQAVVTAPDMSTIGEKTITVSFGGKEATYTINVAVNADLDDLSGTWVLVTDASQLVAGKKVIIAEAVESDGEVKSMGVQNNTNRAAIVSTVASGILSPNTATKTFTLVDAGSSKWALQGTDSKYLYAASSSSNYLKSQDEIDNNATWTIGIENSKAAITANGTNTRKIIRFNSTSSLFSCYASGQSDIALYIQQQEDIPVVPQPDYTRSITAGQFGTICLPNGGTIEGATIFEIAHKKDGKIFFDEISEATMVAGRPYIFYPNNGASKLKVYYTGSENAAADSYNGLYGSYVRSQLAQNDGNYILYDNKYYLVDSEAYVGANRAYIKLGEVPTEEQAPAPGRRRVSMDVQGEQVATSIINTHYSDQPMKVMIDNQLYIIRAGQMFDMTGNKIK